ncbi:MAG: DUF1573 domain-containing protein [Saprospiraceae bacterium]
MKNFKFLTIFTFILAIGMVSCKNDGSTAKDAARESLATTSTTATTPTATPAKPAAPVVPVGPLTSIKFEDSTFDYGEIKDGEVVEHVYKFKNTGKEPLVISNAKGSCGCTVPSWPREPIPVGGSGEISVKFNSKGKGKVGGGAQSKRVTLTANTDPAQTYLTIKGNVFKDEDKKPS